MTKVEATPTTEPVNNWQSYRDAWVSDVTALVTEVDGWCKAEGWATRVIPRKLRDNQVGEHVVPALLLQVEFAQLLLEPVSPRAPGCDGVVDLYLLPQYDDIASVSRKDGGWHIYAGRDWDGHGDILSAPGLPFARQVFVDTVNRMVADARERAH